MSPKTAQPHHGLSVFIALASRALSNCRQWSSKLKSLTDTVEQLMATTFANMADLGEKSELLTDAVTELHARDGGEEPHRSVKASLHCSVEITAGIALGSATTSAKGFEFGRGTREFPDDTERDILSTSQNDHGFGVIPWTKDLIHRFDGNLRAGACGLADFYRL